MNTASLVRRYCLLVYWLLFAGLTVCEARFPGLVLNPDKWRYPWGAVVAVWTLLAILVGGLYVILRPRTFHRSWRRLIGALAYSAVLFALGVASIVTDMPGYYYVPAQFAVVTLAGMLILVLVQGLRALWRRRTHAA
jgi:hypothetical protein